MGRIWGGETFSLLRGTCVLCASSGFSSHLSPARLWPRPCNRIALWKTWICMITTSAMKGQRLGVRWGWCHEGSGSEEIQKGRIKAQLSALNLRCRCPKGWWCDAKTGYEIGRARFEEKRGFREKWVLQMVSWQRSTTQTIAGNGFLLLVHSTTKLCRPFSQCKTCVYNKNGFLDFSPRAGTAGVEHPQAMEMIEEALKRNRSKQPGPNWEIRVIRNLSTKIHGDEGDEGLSSLSDDLVGWKVYC